MSKRGSDKECHFTVETKEDLYKRLAWYVQHNWKFAMMYRIEKSTDLTSKEFDDILHNVIHKAFADFKID